MSLQCYMVDSLRKSCLNIFLCGGRVRDSEGRFPFFPHSNQQVNNDIHIPLHIGSYFSSWVKESEIAQRLWKDHAWNSQVESGSCTVGPSQDSRPCKEFNKKLQLPKRMGSITSTCYSGAWRCVPNLKTTPIPRIIVPHSTGKALQAAMDSKLQGGLEASLGGHICVYIYIKSRHSSAFLVLGISPNYSINHYYAPLIIINHY